MTLNDFRSQEIKWDKANKQMFTAFKASSGDSNGRKLSVQVLDEGKIVDLTGVVLSLAWQTKNKKNYGLDAFQPVDATKGIFEIFYTTEMLSNTGTLRASLVLVDGTGRVESDSFSIMVKDSVVNDSSVQSENSFTALTEALIQISKYQSDIDGIKQDLVDESNQLITTEKAELDALQLDYAERAETLEETYAPRLTEVTAQLEQNDYFGLENQTNFVEIINNSNAVPSKIMARIRSDRTFEVCIPFKGNESQQWYVEKDPNDDFMKLSGGYISEYELGSIQTETRKYDSKIGVYGGSGSNIYTTELGATLTLKFNGNGIIFRHYADTRGGVWKFVIDGNEALTKEVTTYSETTGITQTTVFENLPDGEHTMIGTFVGADVNNPPSDGVARGWVYDTFTFYVLENAYTFNKKIELFKMASNKEFAILVKPTSATTAQWFPEHNGVGTTFAISQEIYFGNELQEDFTFQNNYSEYNMVQVIQKMYGKHPENANNLVEITSILTFNADGVFTNTKIKALEDFHIQTGYAMMSPINPTFSKDVITSFGNVYATSGENKDFIENDKSISILFPGSGSFADYAGAVSIMNPKKTFRVGGSGRKEPMTWLQNRDASLAKVYPQIFNYYDVSKGEVFNFTGRYTMGSLPFASELYS